MTSLAAVRRLAKRTIVDYDTAQDIFPTNSLRFNLDPDVDDITPDQTPFVTPPNVMREIQVQFITDTSGQLTVTYDGGSTFVSVNNIQAIDGIATFTIFVDNETNLNFKFSVAMADLIMWIGG